MNEHDRQRLIQDYLDRLARELEGVPTSTRRELMEDVRGHVEEAWLASPERNRAALLSILDRLGPPETLAREERERLGLDEPQTRRGPGLLEVAAIVLTFLGALTPVIWLLGVLLAWLSPRWLTRDKVVATLMPLLGLLIGMSLMAVGQASYTAAPVMTRVVVQERVPDGSGEQLETRMTPSPASGSTSPAAPDRGAQTVLAVVLVFGVFLGGPFVTALYLALRMRPHPRRAGTVMLAMATALVLCVLVALLLAPATVRVSGVSGEPLPASQQVPVGR